MEASARSWSNPLRREWYSFNYNICTRCSSRHYGLEYHVPMLQIVRSSEMFTNFGNQDTIQDIQQFNIIWVWWIHLLIKSVIKRLTNFMINSQCLMVEILKWWMMLVKAATCDKQTSSQEPTQLWEILHNDPQMCDTECHNDHVISPGTDNWSKCAVGTTPSVKYIIISPRRSNAMYSLNAVIMRLGHIVDSIWLDDECHIRQHRESKIFLEQHSDACLSKYTRSLRWLVLFGWYHLPMFIGFVSYIYPFVSQRLHGHWVTRMIHLVKCASETTLKNADNIDRHRTITKNVKTWTIWITIGIGMHLSYRKFGFVRFDQFISPIL